MAIAGKFRLKAHNFDQKSFHCKNYEEHWLHQPRLESRLSKSMPGSPFLSVPRDDDKSVSNPGTPRVTVTRVMTDEDVEEEINLPEDNNTTKVLDLNNVKHQTPKNVVKNVIQAYDPEVVAAQKVRLSKLFYN